MTTNTPTKWMQLTILPNENEIQHIFNLNACEFILCSSKFGSGYNLYKYNTLTNTFNELVSNSDFKRWHSIKVAFDLKQQTFYIRHENDIYSHNITTNNINTFQNETVNEYGGYCLFINDHLHIIRNHNSHWIFSIENNTLNVVSNPTNKNTEERMNGAAIFIPSKQLILLIGGYLDSSLGELLSDIWIYSLQTQKWKKINNISFERFGFAHILTSNQRYIIFFGGWKFISETDKDEQVDDIFVLDMKDDNNWKLEQCKIKCPVSGACYGAITGGIDSNNQILVNGFVKQCFKLKEFSKLQLPPGYIVNIIREYFNAEMIHYIDDTNHYGIYLKHILSSVCES